MPRNRVSPRVKARHKRAMRNVVDGLGRKVTIYKQPLKSECPNCFYDKMTSRSTGKCKWTPAQALAKNDNTKYKYFLRGRCPICKGKGYLEVQRKTYVNCLIIWDPSQRGFGNKMTYTPAGPEGSTVVQLKTQPKHFDSFKNSTKLIVDGVECKMSRAPLLRGLGVQAIMLITAFTTDKPKIDSNEIIKDYT